MELKTRKVMLENSESHNRKNKQTEIYGELRRSSWRDTRKGRNEEKKKILLIKVFGSE